MGAGIIKPDYVEHGTARDVETIVRLRNWIEDEVNSSQGSFSHSKLITDYDAQNDVFSFQLLFYK